MTTIMKLNKSLPGLKITDFEDKSLLIVDDDDPLRMRLSRAMEKKGCQVQDAKTVENAIKMVIAAPPENPMSADRVKWEHIHRVFELCNRNVSETARRLKMHRRTLQRILSKRSPK